MTNILDELKDKVYQQLAMNVPVDKGANDYFNETINNKIENLRNYANHIRKYEKDSEDFIKEYADKNSHTKEQLKEIERTKKTYRNAITCLYKLIDNQFLDNNAQSKARYEAEHNIYNSHSYFENTLVNLGYKNNYLTLITLGYFNISSLQENKNYVYSQIKDDDLLVEHYFKCYNIKTVPPVENDLFFNTFNSLSDKEKYELVKNNTEITNIALDNTLKPTQDVCAILGEMEEDVAKKESFTDFRDNPEEARNILNKIQ